MAGEEVEIRVSTPVESEALLAEAEPMPISEESVELLAAAIREAEQARRTQEGSALEETLRRIEADLQAKSKRLQQG